MILTIANQKGGVGKTTTTAALSVGLHQRGFKVLAVDVDPQGNLTQALGISDEQAKTGPNLFTVIEEVDWIGEAVTVTQSGVELIPNTTDLAHSDLHQKIDRERILSRLLSPLESEYDLILLDAPPALGLLTYNALAAADSVIVPVQCEAYAVTGLAELMKTTTAIRHYQLNPNCDIGGVVLTMFDGRRNLDKRIATTIQDTLGDLVFETTIPRDVRLAELGETGNTSLLTGESHGAVAYRHLTKEVVNRWLTQAKTV